MSLYQQIKTTQLEARKEKNTININLFTTLLGEIQTANTGNKTGNNEILDSDVIKVINKFIKSTKETLKLTPNNKVATLELEILETFLPKQLTDEELTAIIVEVKTQCHSTLQPNAIIGFVMKHLKTNYENQYDASKVKDIVLGI